MARSMCITSFKGILFYKKTHDDISLIILVKKVKMQLIFGTKLEINTTSIQTRHKTDLNRFLGN